MRDPLARVAIRYKLALAFLLVAGVSLGAGGLVAWRTSRAALVERVLADLAREARFRADHLGERIASLQAQTLDFGSDGLVRELSTRLAEAPEQQELVARLQDHLRAQKLPRIVGLLEILILDGHGRVLAGTGGIGASEAILSFTAPLPRASLVNRVGREGIASAVGGVGGSEAEVSVRLLDESGGLVLHSGAPRPQDAEGGDAAFLSAEHPVPGRPWRLVVEVPAASALAPVVALRQRLLLVGLGLALFCAVLCYFPLKYMVGPLTRLAQAARRTLEDGRPIDVEVPGHDEIADLAQALRHTSSGLLDRAAQLDQERSRFRAAIDGMSEGLVFIDRNGRVVLANQATPQARRLAGRIDVPLLAGDARLAGLIEQVRATGRTVEQDEWTEDERLYEGAASPVLDSAGRQLGVVWIHRDTTEARKSERRAAESEKLAGIGRLAAGIAHELGTPLGSIVFFAEEVADEIRTGRCMACTEGAKLLSLLSQVQRNAYRCKRIGRKLLDFGVEDEEVLLERVEVEGLVREAIGLVRASRPGAPEIVVQGGPLGALAVEAGRMVRTDREKLLTALIAILENAVQAAGPEGRVAVGWKLDERGLELEVSDDGPGIAPEHLKKIFEPFYTTKGPGEGTGLGLSIAYGKLHSLGGRIDVESGSRSGTTFRIVLPEDARDRARDVRQEEAD